MFANLFANRKTAGIDPVTGRYIQSDPIGFDGGINTYVYVGSNSVVKVDEKGLRVSVIFKTEVSIGNWSAWNTPAKYAAQLSREEGKTLYIFEVNKGKSNEFIFIKL